MTLPDLQLNFIVPDPEHFPSGGNIYNAELMRALDRTGIRIAHYPLEDWVSRQPYSKGRQVINLVDTLYLSELEQLGIFDEGQAKWLLIVHHLTSLEHPPSERAAYFNRHERSLLSFFQGFLVTSLFTSQYLVDMGFARDKIICVEPAFVPPKSAGKEKVQGIKALMVANLIPRKNILAFLEGLENQTVLPDQLTISIIGSDALDPVYARACKVRLKRLFPKVLYLGSKTHQATIDYYQECNLFISVATMETFGMAVQEAVAMGLPVLALSRGHLSAHIEQRMNGYLYPQMEALIQGLMGLIKGDELVKLNQSAAEKARSPQRDWTAAATSFLAQLQKKV